MGLMIMSVTGRLFHVVKRDNCGGVVAREDVKYEPPRPPNRDCERYTHRDNAECDRILDVERRIDSAIHTGR